MTEPSNSRSFMQSCWVVSDLEVAIDHWTRTAGVGPFFWFDGVDFTDGRYRGEAAEFPRVSAAIAYAGDHQIELVSQDNEDPGVFRDVFARGEGGLHHLARRCENYEAERDGYVRAGAGVAFEGVIGSSRTCWVDTTASLGVMIELLEADQQRDGWFAHMRKAADHWDGTNPIIGRPSPPAGG